MKQVNKQYMPALSCISYKLMYSETCPSVNIGETLVVPADFIWGQQWRVKAFSKALEGTGKDHLPKNITKTTVGQEYPLLGSESLLGINILSPKDCKK